MPEAPSPIQASVRAARAGTTVVLVAPEALGAFREAAALRDALALGPPERLRVLVRVADGSDLPLVDALAAAGLEVEALLGVGVPAPASSVPFARMPPGGTAEHADEFALALSDALLVAAGAEAPIARRARELRKRVVEPGQPIPAAASAPRIAEGIDPEAGWWCGLLGRCVGRIEQGLLEALAFRRQDGEPGGFARSRRGLRDCFRFARRPRAHFAPDPPWREFAPDRDAASPTVPVVEAFETFDRSAVLGASLHRDVIWVAHLGAAFAVLFAVAGALKLWPSIGGLGWAWVELSALVLVAAFVLAARRSRLQERWMACRLAAEQLRVARMCVPLMAVPDALSSSDRAPARGAHGAEAARRAIDAVKRAVRDQGLPRHAGGLSLATAKRWLELLVADQAAYHRDNRHKLEAAERRLNRLTNSVFLLAFAAVVVHLGLHYSHRHADWLLLATAAFPAFAAALHGAGTRLGIVHRAALSEEVEAELSAIAEDLGELRPDPPEAEDSVWPKLRLLAQRAARAMGAENTSWHSLVRRHQVGLP